MTELQGAVGIAQLNKLDLIIKRHKKNKNLILKKLKLLSDISLREVPNYSTDSAEALIFYVKNKNKALKCREALLKVGVSTKILPEATTWHFAKHWHHMKELRLFSKGTNYLNKSEEILNRAVSIPITFYMDKNIPNKIYNAILKALN